MAELTQLLHKAHSGDPSASAELFSAAYPMLQQLARARLRGGRRNTMLDTRSLVHESYLRFTSGASLRATDRRAFFAYASEVMRSVIVSTARERAAQKRGSGLRPLTLTPEMAAELADSEDSILRVHEALSSLEQVDARLARLVQMRYFGGYSEAEIADALGITGRTVQRLWLKARLMLHAAMA